jgi:hypothetical protein
MDGGVDEQASRNLNVLRGPCPRPGRLCSCRWRQRQRLYDGSDRQQQQREGAGTPTCDYWAK